MLHRTLAFASALLLSASALVAQTSVWKITRGSQTLYLGGTCHVLRAEDFPLPAEYDQAYAASSTLVFETDIARLRSPEMQQVVVREGMLPGTTLDKVLTPEAWKKVQAYFASTPLPPEQVARFKPWLLTMMMAVFELQKLGITQTGVDMHYYDKAQKAGKKTGELETFEKQLSYITHLGEGYESEMVTQTINELHELPGRLRQILGAWKSGDIAKLEDLFIREMREKYPAVFKSLIVERNDAWVPKIDDLLKSPDVEFVLVGAGHLPGKEGLLAQLRARGCTIEQLKAPAAAPAKK